MTINPLAQTNGKLSENAFVSWHDDDSRAVAFQEMGKSLNKIEGIYHSSRAALGNQFQGIDTNTSVRSPFSRMDYEYFRPTEMLPRQQKNIIGSCMHAYRKIGLIKNVIDLMADFACQGIRLTHRNPSIEKFYQAWWEQVNGRERSERFLNMLYRSGNVIVKRSTVTLGQKQIDDFKKTVADYLTYPSPTLDGQDGEFIAGPDINIEEKFEPRSREVPWRYTILNPLTVNVLGEEITAFTGDPFFTVNIPPQVASYMRSPKTDAHKRLVESISSDILDPVLAGKRDILLDPTKTISMYYKKDDWAVWADPMLYSILDDLVLLEKMKLADLTALDGAIQHIRIWKLGNLQEKILPTDAAISKLANLLLNNVGGGSMDLIWGPDLELEETSTDVQKFLGSEKYGPVLNSICAGLGIPLSMTGNETEGSYNRNFISLKTIIERLMYGRSLNTAMWKKEIAIVQKAMGFRYPADILYDNMVLTDDASEKALWIQMWDRNLASDETVQEKFGQIPEVEFNRIMRENLQRKSGQRPEKASPFVDSQPQLSKEKIALQRGLVGPGDVGVEGKPVPEMFGTPKGQPQQGRPRNSNDKIKRKKRIVKPSTKAEQFMAMANWASYVQKDIAEIINPLFIARAGKKDLRGLTDAELKDLERFKFVVLYNTEAHTEINDDSLAKLLEGNLLVYEYMDKLKEKMVAQYVSTKGHTPPPDEMRQLQAYVYTVFKGDFDGDNNSDGGHREGYIDSNCGWEED